MFRRERPQKGRYRQFYQIGAEVLGSQNPLVDVELIEMLVLFLERVGIRESQLLINSVGCPDCRAAYLEVLREALQAVKATMCTDCQRRADTNPLRVLDCKVEADQPIIEKLPKIIDHLDSACRQHFDRVTCELQSRGLAYQVTPRLVRGLDYYTRTTFEITSGALGAQNAVVGGGRYDGLSEILGGPPTPGIGFSIGQDRLILAVQAAAQLRSGYPLAAYIVWMGEAALAPAARLARELRVQGLSIEIDYDPMKIKKAMGVASKLQARFAIIIGEGELASGKYQVKDLASGEQQAMEPANICQHLKEKLGCV
jgi:histidyl-tRNA synthetase